MQIIQKLSDMIEEELHDAEKYIRCAIDLKDEYPTVSATFARLSEEEMGHVNQLHTQVTVLIQEYRKEHGEPPERMQAVYDYLHKRQIDKATEIRVMQGLLKESR